MKKLSDAEFKSTIDKPANMAEGQPVFDFWPYVDDIPEEDYEGHDCSKGDIYKVFRMEGNDYEHVLICSTSDDVYMALVNDLANKVVLGHRLLDYGKMQKEK